MNRSTSANATISSNLRAPLAAHAENGAVQEHVLTARLRSGWKTRADFEERPDAALDRRTTRGGAVMRVSSLSSVLFPAPFRR
jgi:hypothetical protein